jgi:hypothetical protein
VTRCRSGTGSRDHTLSTDQAREAAQGFVQDDVSGFSADRQSVDRQLVDREAVGHLEGDALRLPRRPPVEAGEAGACAVTAEADRRTGAVVHLSAARGTADAASFPLSAEDAIAAARAAVGDEHLSTNVAGDTRRAGRWTVTIGRGPSGRVEVLLRDTQRLDVDARTRAVLGQRGAYEIDADRSLPLAEGAPRTVTRYGYGGEVTPPTTDYGGEVTPATTGVEEAPGGAAPEGTQPVSIRTPAVSRTAHEASVPDLYIDASDDGIGRENGAGSEYRFPGDGLGMADDTGNYRAESAAHRYQPSPRTFTPKSISPATRHKEISGSSCVRRPAHHKWSGFHLPAAAERRESRPHGDRPRRRQLIPQFGCRYRPHPSVRHPRVRFALDPPQPRQVSAHSPNQTGPVVCRV